MANSFPKKTVFRRSGYWVKCKSRYRRLYYHGKCLLCEVDIWRTTHPKKKRQLFCGYKCSGVYQNKGKRSRNYKGGRKIDIHGYVLLYCPNHCNSSVDGYIKEHRFVMSKHLKRPLTINEAVHHINGNRRDNRIVNLCLMSRGEHASLHLSNRKLSEETKSKISIWHKEHPRKRDKVTKRFTGEYI